MSDHLVSLENVEVHFESQGLLDFGDPEVVQAVDGVSLDIERTTSSRWSASRAVERPRSARPRSASSGRPAGASPTAARTSGTRKTIVATSTSLTTRSAARSRSSTRIRGVRSANRRVMKILEAPLKRWQGQMSAGDRRREVLSMLERVGMTPPGDYAGRYPTSFRAGRNNASRSCERC